MELWHVYGLGGLFRVHAIDESDALVEARKLGMRNSSWACLAADSCFKRGEAQN